MPSWRAPISQGDRHVRPHRAGRKCLARMELASKLQQGREGRREPLPYPAQAALVASAQAQCAWARKMRRLRRLIR